MMVPFFRRLAVTAVALALVVTAARLHPLDGVVHGGPLQLPGHLHPLLVHFPIVLLLLVPILELAGVRRPALREAAGFVLGLALPFTVLAVLAGLALAYADGQDGALVTSHLRGGTLVAVGTALAWLARPQARAVYRLLLAATVGTLAWAAHNGGSITHGQDYLTAPLPAAVRHALHLKDPPAPEVYTSDTVFGSAVRPTLEKHCFSCHGPEKQKGDYRMDTFAALLAGGKSGQPAIIPGDLLRSELLRRLTLEPGDDKAMPPRQKPRPTSAEIALLHWWIKQGAPRDLPLAAATGAPTEVAALLARPASAPGAGSAGEPAYVPRVGDYAALREEITRLEMALGIRLVPVSQRPGDGLILRVRGAEARFGDAELAQLNRVAPFVVEAELAGTRLTDAGLGGLRPFDHLERLHLERTAVTGATLRELQALPRLTYLNLCQTAVTDETLAGLTPLTGLQEVYLYGSRVTPAGLLRLKTALPHCELGPIAAAPEAAATP